MEHEEDPRLSAGEVQAAAGLTYRQLNDWESRGALPSDPNRARGWRKFSPREVFVLMVCAEIRRRFGTPIERIKFVSDFMLQPGTDHFSAAIRLMDMLGVGVWLMTDFEDTFVMDSELEFRDMAAYGFFGGEDHAGYVVLKLNPLVNRLLACLNDPVQLPSHGLGYQILREIERRFGENSPAERQVLDAIRSGDFSKIEVVTREGKITTIRTIGHPSPTESVEDLLSWHDFQRLVVTKRNGQVVSVEQQATEKAANV